MRLCPFPGVHPQCANFRAFQGKRDCGGLDRCSWLQARIGVVRSAERCPRNGSSRTQSFKFEKVTIDYKIFARHPPRGEPLLKAPPNCAARELRQSVGGDKGLLLVFDNET